jgi:hypothetical protein
MHISGRMETPCSVNMPAYEVQGAAEITPTFQKGITNKWYEISPKTFYFPNVDITKFFYFRFSK